MANPPEQEVLSEYSSDSELDYELEKGIPQVEDHFIQTYLNGRDALVEQEKKQRHGRLCSPQ